MKKQYFIDCYTKRPYNLIRVEVTRQIFDRLLLDKPGVSSIKVDVYNEAVSFIADRGDLTIDDFNYVRIVS